MGAFSGQHKQPTVDPTTAASTIPSTSTNANERSDS